MSLFSQRKGLRPLKKAFQREAVDKELRNRLWSAFQIVVWNKWSSPSFSSGYDLHSRLVNSLLDKCWMNFFKWPLDTRPDLNPSLEDGAYIVLRNYFYKAEWYEVYDFIEFVIKNVYSDWAKALKDFCNALLEDENAAYRILNDEVVEITDELEINAIEEAIELPVTQITTHLKRSLELLSDKNNPDYRNSIKESISSVEACCQYISNDSNATLGDALKKIKVSTPIHPALEKGFLAIYGYTNDSGGIRHALEDENQTPSYADAKFMLVACSTFVNFLLTKTVEAGTKIRKK